MEYLVSFDVELFYFLNGLHTAWLDPVMFFLTKTLAWLPLYGLLIYLIINQYRRKSWIALLCIILCFTATDRFTSGFMKPYFERLRPSHDPALQSRIHLVNDYKGGMYGFASSHAANSFGIAFLLVGLLRGHRYIGWLFGWALFISYTRIYLGVHYPGDILVGALVGIVCGWIFYRLWRFLQNRFG